MSRVGKKPIKLPDSIKITYEHNNLKVEGKKGVLERSIHSSVVLHINDGLLTVQPNDDKKKTIAIQGLTRALVANMVHGTHNGFERVLEINGIGYRAEVKDNQLILNIGYSKPITFVLPKAVTATVEKNLIKLYSIDKELLGVTSASIRYLRPPEPYKGKGIKFIEEVIQRKAGKSAK